MATPQEQTRTGIDFLDAATELLQRIRGADPTAGLFEAADVQWWWRSPRTSDDSPQLFWFDDRGRPEAAVISTDWGSWTAITPILMPDAPSDHVAHVVTRGLAHIIGDRDSKGETDGDSTGAFGLEVDKNDRDLSALLTDNGFTIAGDGLVEAWLRADERPGISPLHDDYRLVRWSELSDRPHHMIERHGPDVEARLGQTSLYRPDLDLVVLDEDENAAAKGLFWFDPVTATGLVEPMRTEDEHQRRGLARHILTRGVDLLAEAGATRIKICYEVDNVGARDLYLDAGFVPDRQTVFFSRRTGESTPT